jgi:zinc protease
VAVSGNISPTIDPYLYTVSAVVRPGRTLAEVETALETELDRLAEEPITQAELDKAMKRAKAQFVMAGESVSGQGQMIGMAEAVSGDYRWYERTLETLEAVTLADIERVRREYMVRTNRTVALYEPSGNGQ